MLVRTICGHDIRVVPGTVKVHIDHTQRDMFGPVCDIRASAQAKTGRYYQILREEIPLVGSARYHKRHDKLLAECLNTVKNLKREFA